MDEQAFKEKTKSIAVLAIRLVQTLPPNAAVTELGRQFLRCATAMGVPCRHTYDWRAPGAMRDMLQQTIHAAEECLYWLELFSESALVQRDRAEQMAEEITIVLDMAAQALRQQQNGRVTPAIDQTVKSLNDTAAIAGDANQ